MKEFENGHRALEHPDFPWQIPEFLGFSSCIANCERATIGWLQSTSLMRQRARGTLWRSTSKSWWFDVLKIWVLPSQCQRLLSSMIVGGGCCSCFSLGSFHHRRGMMEDGIEIDNVAMNTVISVAGWRCLIKKYRHPSRNKNLKVRAKSKVKYCNCNTVDEKVLAPIDLVNILLFPTFCISHLVQDIFPSTPWPQQISSNLTPSKNIICTYHLEWDLLVGRDASTSMTSGCLNEYGMFMTTAWPSVVSHNCMARKPTLPVIHYQIAQVGDSSLLLK